MVTFQRSQSLASRQSFSTSATSFKGPGKSLRLSETCRRICSASLALTPLGSVTALV